MAGSSLSLACDAAIAKGRAAAGALLEAAEADIEFQDGAFRVAGTDRTITLLEVARQVREKLQTDLPDTLDSTGDYDADELNFPNGCHICEVEIDRETGVVRVDRYVGVDDVGVAFSSRHRTRPGAWRRRAGARPGADGERRL